MAEPLFWLGLSLLLVAVSLTAVLIAAWPVLQELSRAARSLEKLCNTLDREFPPTLEAMRLTSLELSELTEELDEGVKSVGNVTQSVDQGVATAKQGVTRVQGGTRRLLVGIRAAWQVWQAPPKLPAGSKSHQE